MKRFGIILIAALLVVMAALVFPVSAVKPDDNGFNEYGYNYQARIFNGPYSGWLKYKGLPIDPIYGNDHLVMKWNAEWDRGNTENWANPPYDAWENNEWNGAFPDGSGEVWHYKIIWVGSGLESSDYWSPGGYAIWGQFEVIMDHGTTDGVHKWVAHGIPTGYGTIKNG